VSTASTAVTYTLDATKPTAKLLAEALVSSGSATVQSSEVGKAYLVRDDVSYITQADLDTLASATTNKKCVSINVVTANFDTSLSVSGLQPGIYKLVTADAAGNLSDPAPIKSGSAAPSTVLVTNAVTPITLMPMIDLGLDATSTDRGNLVSPVFVDGKWYAHWDLSDNGTSADSGLLNGGLDTVTHDFLDAIFKYSVSGVVNPAAGTNTDATYRYATLGSFKLALPTVGNAETTYALNTAIQDTNVRGEINTLDDYQAIYDAFYTAASSIPSGWRGVAPYWTATPGPVTPNHYSYHLMAPAGGALSTTDLEADRRYVALQIYSVI
jgi:hypothetical protein